MQDFEKLGAFYLGKGYDAEQQKVGKDLLLYDAKDLTTHAVCVGMTGSGKTGLCVTLLEEAAIDGIPALLIDPKGDLGNLMLNFPKLRPEDFRPWIDEAAATRKGRSPEEEAQKISSLWKKGLKDWGQGPQRIKRLRDACEVDIYTPGSQAGLPIQILRSFSAPPPELQEDADAFRERVSATATSLLALLGIDADPIKSREHILISRLFQHAWEQGQDLELTDLIRQVQKPPIQQVGALDMDTFFPAKDRGELAMMLNNLLASPGFAAWCEGEPLDIQRLLWTPDGKPRLCILSIAHLNDAERMFFVTLLLNEVIAWMRTQAGTSSLRALLYMDEVFGFFPPVANPPSKMPLLTLLKQARAYGLGVVLATQNPVDLDYKGLSNAGTWFLGRLQTQGDKDRVMEGLKGAAAAAGKTMDLPQLETLLSGLQSRVFLMNNVHEDEPVLFHTRWALSYLRGPLTRVQIQKLMAERKNKTSKGLPTLEKTVGSRKKKKPQRVKSSSKQSERPILPAEIPERFLSRQKAIKDNERLLYRPALFGSARMHFVQTKKNIDCWQNISIFNPQLKQNGHSLWDGAEILQNGGPEFEAQPEGSAEFAKLPPKILKKRSASKWDRVLSDYLYRNKNLTLWQCVQLKAHSKPQETKADFQIRVSSLAREKRDQELEKLKKRYTPKLARIQERISRAEARVGREESQYKQQKLQSAISIGGTLLGAFLGRKIGSATNVRQAASGMRSVSRASREKTDIARAQDSLGRQRDKLRDLEEEFEDSLTELQDRFDPSILEIEPMTVRPRKTDIAVEEVALVWSPWRIDGEGIAEPAFEME